MDQARGRLSTASRLHRVSGDLTAFARPARRSAKTVDVDAASLAERAPATLPTPQRTLRSGRELSGSRQLLVASGLTATRILPSGIKTQGWTAAVPTACGPQNNTALGEPQCGNGGTNKGAPAGAANGRRVSIGSNSESFRDPHTVGEGAERPLSGPSIRSDRDRSEPPL